ncbi:hypothetical protein DFJ73DRAFT_838371, partial [Zopfochytrium polystomum]
MERAVATASALGARDDYRDWLMVYVQKLVDEGAVGKVKDLCDEVGTALFRDGSSAENPRLEGLDYRELLKEMVGIIGTKREFQRLTATYSDLLSRSLMS